VHAQGQRQQQREATPCARRPLGEQAVHHRDQRHAQRRGRGEGDHAAAVTEADGRVEVPRQHPSPKASRLRGRPAWRSRRAASHSSTGASSGGHQREQVERDRQRHAEAHQRRGDQPKCSLLSTSKISPVGCPASKFGS
jgi:hypothetical protein